MKQYAFLILLASAATNNAHNQKHPHSQKSNKQEFCLTSQQNKWGQTYSLKMMPLKACKAMATALDELYHLQPSQREEKTDSLFKSFYEYIKPRQLPTECFNAVLKVYENACLASAKAKTPQEKDHCFKKAIEPYYDMVMTKINLERENKEKPVKFAFGDREKTPLPASLYDTTKTKLNHQLKTGMEQQKSKPVVVFESINISWQVTTFRVL